MFSQQIVMLHGQKYLKWHDNFFQIASESRDHDVIVNNFLAIANTFLLLERSFDAQLLRRNLGLILTSLGVQCQNLFN